MDPANLPPEALQAHTLSAESLHALARRLGVELGPAACATLLGYARLLQRWNRVHNLTAISDDAELLTHHLLDSLAIVRPLEQALSEAHAGRPPEAAIELLDAGSGAGLPGIPLAVALPGWRATLVDAVQKKCAFLRQAQLELHLPNVRVLHARLERLDRDAARPAYDVVVARAFSSLSELVERTRHLLRPGGVWAAMKGRDPAVEIAALPADVELVRVVKLRVPALLEDRRLVVLRAAAPWAPAEGQNDGARRMR